MSKFDFSDIIFVTTGSKDILFICHGDSFKVLAFSLLPGFN